jgi:peroxiredoxin
MALKYSEMIPLGSEAKPFKLKGVDGKIHRLEDYQDKKVLLVVFMCNHCPYVIATQDRINDIQKDYASKGVQVVGINSNDVENYPDDSYENMQKRAQEKSYAFDYLIDESQEVAKAYGAVCTPDLFVFDKNRKLQYRGRIDDNWKEPEKVTEKDLRRALDEILEQGSVSFEQKPSMGCSIKWKAS